MGRYNYVGLGTRIVALLVDGVLFMVPYVIINYISSEVGSEYIFIGRVVHSLIVIAYCCLMPVYLGGTLGKRFIKIRIVDYDGNNLSYMNAFMRYLPFAIIAVTSLFIDTDIGTGNTIIGVGILIFHVLDTIALVRSDEKQSIHDWLAKSYVVKDDELYEINRVHSLE